MSYHLKDLPSCESGLTPPTPFKGYPPRRVPITQLFNPTLLFHKLCLVVHIFVPLHSRFPVHQTTPTLHVLIQPLYGLYSDYSKEPTITKPKTESQRPVTLFRKFVFPLTSLDIKLRQYPFRPNLSPYCSQYSVG